jgi:hypothetical protein
MSDVAIVPDTSTMCSMLLDGDLNPSRLSDEFARGVMMLACIGASC